MEINELWVSKDESQWLKALDYYWNLIKPANMELGKRMDNLNAKAIENMDLNEFYESMIDDYFQWKYTNSRWLKRNTDQFSRYIKEERLNELK